MSHFQLDHTSDNTGDVHAVMQDGSHAGGFGSEQVQTFFIPSTTVSPHNLFFGASSAQLGIPFSDNVGPNQQSNNSHTGSQTSSVLNVTNGNRLRKSDLPSGDRRNFDRACDLLILEVIENIGWDTATDQFVVTAQECLSQACADSAHFTEWDENFQRLFVEHVQSFRSKMATRAEKFAKGYELSNIVDQRKLLLLVDRRTAAIAHCERMLMDVNWEIYYLHHYDTETRRCVPFGNPIFVDYHLATWYKSSTSLFHGNSQTLAAWGSTPLRLLATSAAALACGLRRAAQGVGLSGRPAVTVRYSLPEYSLLEQQIYVGMQNVSKHPHAHVQATFRAFLLEIHMRGCRLVDGGMALGFYLPPVHQLHGMVQNTSTDSNSEHDMPAHE